MEATFEIAVSYTVTGKIKDGPRILLRNGAVMIAADFSARVFPGRGLGGVPRLKVDRHLTVTGPKLKADETPGVVHGKEHFWLSEENTPTWVLALVAQIESVEAPHVATPAPVSIKETP
jgi:hypothetical protein